jgi:hypothetical protein
MSRYYFNLREDDELVPDDEGVELPTIESARDEAIRGLADCARDAICNAACARIAVEVLDGGRKPLFIATLNFQLTLLYHEETNRS